jgi:hypothetical protein
MAHAGRVHRALLVRREAAEKACRVGSRKSPASGALKQKTAAEAISNRLMARPAGLESTTPWFVRDRDPVVH